MITPDGENLSIQKQASLLKLRRSSVFYRPQWVSAADLELMEMMELMELMRQIDERHLDSPFADSRMLRDLLAQHRTQRRNDMRLLAIEAIYHKLHRTAQQPTQALHLERKSTKANDILENDIHEKVKRGKAALHNGPSV